MSRQRFPNLSKLAPYTPGWKQLDDPVPGPAWHQGNEWIRAIDMRGAFPRWSTNLQMPGGMTPREYMLMYDKMTLPQQTALRNLDYGYTIPENAFRGCEVLALTELPRNITHIGESAFYGCKNLALKELPATVTHIGKSAFHGCENLGLAAQQSIERMDAAGGLMSLTERSP